MSLALRLRQRARRDLERISDQYDAEQEGLGHEFLAEVGETLHHLEEWPELTPVIGRMPDNLPIRKRNLKRFEYQIIYVLDGQSLHVLAVFHARSDPARLQDRTTDER